MEERIRSCPSFIKANPKSFMSLVKHRIGKGENWIYRMADMSSSGDIIIPLRKANRHDLVLLQIQAKNTERLPNLHSEVEKSRKITVSSPEVTNVLVVITTAKVRVPVFCVWCMTGLTQQAMTVFRLECP